jgi:thiol-disulfide isomerase/thioredoxin
VHNVTVGLIVCAAVLASATVFGAFWRRRNGVLRVVATPDAQARQISAALPSAGMSGTGDGPDGASAARSGPDIGPGGPAAPVFAAAGKHGGVLTGAQLGRPLGSRATIVQFSTAFCAPCRATRRILAEVAGMVEGVTHVEIDAEANLPLVRRLGIHSTPTVLVLGADGAIIRRGTGQPRKADVIAALGAATTGAAATGAAATGAAATGAAATGAVTANTDASTADASTANASTANASTVGATTAGTSNGGEAGLGAAAGGISGGA